MFVAERLIRSLVSKYGKHTVYTYGGIWYSEACNVLRLKLFTLHHFSRIWRKELISIKDRIESLTTIHVCKMIVIYNIQEELFSLTN